MPRNSSRTASQGSLADWRIGPLALADSTLSESRDEQPANMITARIGTNVRRRTCAARFREGRQMSVELSLFSKKHLDFLKREASLGSPPSRDQQILKILPKSSVLLDVDQHCLRFAVL